jgi:hypothetical protein
LIAYNKPEKMNIEDSKIKASEDDDVVDDYDDSEDDDDDMVVSEYVYKDYDGEEDGSNEDDANDYTAERVKLAFLKAMKDVPKETAIEQIELLAQESAFIREQMEKHESESTIEQIERERLEHQVWYHKPSH